MKEFHSSSIGGHSGFNKTNNAVKVRYWWTKMTEDIRNYVKMCEQCQKSDPLKPAKKPDLKSIHVTHPFELVGCDLMGPFQETSSGFKYIFTATDYFTKWVEAFPIKTKSATDVSACLKKLLYRHGATNAILTDQGREFLNQVNKDLCEEWGITHKVTAAYHPQTNGLDERTNQTIKRALSKCVNDGQTDWDVHLDQVLFSLRTKPQVSTKYSPFFLLYGRDAQYPSQLPTDFGNGSYPSVPPEDIVDDGVKDRQKEKAETEEKVKHNTDKARAKQQNDFKKANEKRRKYNDIKVGDKVLKHNIGRAQRKAKGDLGKPYLGPYIVEEVVGHRLRLKSLDGIVLKTLVSVNNVKAFREDTTTSADATTHTEPTSTPADNTTHTEPTSTPADNTTNAEPTSTPIQIYIDGLVLHEIITQCTTINKRAKCKPKNVATFSRGCVTCPVLSFVNEVLKTEGELVDEMQAAVLKHHSITEEGDFSGSLLLICCVLTRAYLNDICPAELLETFADRPSFLAECIVEPKPLETNERLTVAGEGLEQPDLDTLKGNKWLNDKVVNGYTKLIAREATDTSDCSGSTKRIFMIPSYTATLWGAGIYDNYMFKKVDFSLYDMIVVPCNKNGNHWVVLVADTKLCTVTVYDSLAADNSHLIEKFCIFMNKRAEVLVKEQQHWEHAKPLTNKQTDGSSCGVFVLMVYQDESAIVSRKRLKQYPRTCEENLTKTK